MRLFLIVYITLSFCSCTQQRLIKDVQQFIGQTIIFPSTVNTTWNGIDTVVTDFMDVPIKLVVWQNSHSCTPCEMNNLYEWNDVIKYADSLSQWFRVAYIFTPKKEDLLSVKTALKAKKLDYPIFIDQNATFKKLNPRLPKNQLLHTFLLDKSNRVVMVGSPLQNPSLWRLYMKTIQKIIDNDGFMPEG